MTVPTGRLIAAHGLVDAAGQTIIPAINERGAYGRWIDGYPVWCICGERLTRTTWTGRPSSLDPHVAPEGRWTHDDGQGGTWDTPAHHVARPLLITDVPWPCASYSPADHRLPWYRRAIARLRRPHALDTTS